MNYTIVNLEDGKMYPIQAESDIRALQAMKVFGLSHLGPYDHSVYLSLLDDRKKPIFREVRVVMDGVSVKTFVNR